MSYQIKTNPIKSELETEVKAAMDNGWHPHGSLVIHPKSGLLYQPMVYKKAWHE